MICLYETEIDMEYFMKLLCDDCNGMKKKIDDYPYDTHSSSRCIREYMETWSDITQEKIERFLLNKEVIEYAQNSSTEIQTKDDIYYLPEEDEDEDEDENDVKPNFEFIDYMKENLLDCKTFELPWPDSDDDHDLYSKKCIWDTVFIIGLTKKGHIMGYYYYCQSYASRKVIEWW